MVTCKCISKERDNSGNITLYLLQDAYNNTCVMAPDTLKMYIKSGNVKVINLKLTSDNRLIDIKIDGLKDADVLENIPYTDNRVPKNLFMSGRSGEPPVEPLMGWMDNDSGEYHESIYGIEGGVLAVSRTGWRIHLQPERSTRIGVWVDPGFQLSGRSIPKYVAGTMESFMKATERMESNPLDNWKFEDKFGNVFTYSPSIYGSGYITMWPKFSQLHIRSIAVLEHYLSKLTACEKRAREIQEIKGWRTDKNRPVMKADGTVSTIETRGNWFNRFFGRK